MIFIVAMSRSYTAYVYGPFKNSAEAFAWGTEKLNPQGYQHFSPYPPNSGQDIIGSWQIATNYGTE